MRCERFTAELTARIHAVPAQGISVYRRMVNWLPAIVLLEMKGAGWEISYRESIEVGRRNGWLKDMSMRKSLVPIAGRGTYAVAAAIMKCWLVDAALATIFGAGFCTVYRHINDSARYVRIGLKNQLSLFPRATR